jgi:hypothetical protein
MQTDPSARAPSAAVSSAGPAQCLSQACAQDAAEQKYLAQVRKQLADVAKALEEKLAKLEPGSPLAAQLQLRREILQRFGEKLGAPPEGAGTGAH